MGRASVSTSSPPSNAEAGFVVGKSPAKNASAFSYVDELQHVPRTRSRHWSGSLSFKVVALFVAHISVMLILLKFCLHLHKRGASSGVSRRRLAERGTNRNIAKSGESAQLSKQCVYVGHELARHTSTRYKLHQRLKEDEDAGPSPKVSRVVPSGMHSTVAPLGFLSLLDTPSLQLQRCPQHFPVHWDDAAVLESVDFAIDRDVGGAPQSVKSPEVHQQLSASSLQGSRGGSSPSPRSASAFQAAPSQANLQLNPLREGSTNARSSTSISVSPKPGPRTGALALALGTAKTPGVAESQPHLSHAETRYDLHRYYRVPRVHPSACTHTFDLRFAMDRNYYETTPIPRLKAIRNLLVKPQLQGSDVLRLLDDTAFLVKTALNCMASNPSDMEPRLAVKALGLRLLVFDTVLAVHQTLGENLLLNMWWNHLKSAVMTDYTFVAKPRHTRKVLAFGGIATRLYRALQTYKQRIRPAPEEVVSLKRMLLCSPITPTYFKGQDFDLWREDDRIFTAGLL